MQPRLKLFALTFTAHKAKLTFFLYDGSNDDKVMRCETKAIAERFTLKKEWKTHVLRLIACVAIDKESVNEFSGDDATVAKEVVTKYAIILEFCSMPIHPCPLLSHH